MKLYIWKHKGAVTEGNLYITADATFYEDNLAAGYAVKAFIRKRDAKKYMETFFPNEAHGGSYELIAIDV